MEWLNLPGLMVLLALLAPNLLFAARRPAARHASPPTGLVIGEQIGRYGCMAFLCLHLGLWDFGFAAPGWGVVWLVLIPLLMFVYMLAWVLYFRRASAGTAMMLAVLPAAMFLLSGLLWRNVPLIAFALLFAFTHIPITARTAHPDA